MSKDGNRCTGLAHLCGTFVIGSLAGMFPALAVAEDGMHHGHGMHHDHAAMDHAAHMSHAQASPVVRSSATYAVPDATLTTMSGDRVSLRTVLAEGPVMVNFIYTSCTTVCPATSATFSQVEKSLKADGPRVRMISISIDPEHDTPSRLKEYAEALHAGADWQFLTGTLADSVAVQRAFGVYRGNKMNHAPVTLLRASHESPWVRMDGFASAAELVAEIRGWAPGPLAKK